MTAAPLPAGERVSLRPLERADAPRVEAFLAVPEVRQALRLGAAAPGEDAAFAAALVEPREEVLLGIAARADGRLLGVCGLNVAGDGARQAELGIFVGDPAEWGKGYGSEAARLLVLHGFRALGLERIRLVVREDHAAAIRAYERAGFRRDRAPAPPRARTPVPTGPALLSMSVLRSEWPPASAPG